MKRTVTATVTVDITHPDWWTHDDIVEAIQKAIGDAPFTDATDTAEIEWNHYETTVNVPVQAVSERDKQTGGARMRPVLTIAHSDGVSGCTTMDDGTKAYWTEGRSSYITIIHPDGRRYSVWQGIAGHEVIEALDLHAGEGPSREMTAGEEMDYDFTK